MKRCKERGCPNEVHSTHKLHVYCEQHSGKKEKHRRSRLKTKYCLTLQPWQDLFESQGSCCAACGTKYPDGDWHTDHIHGTKIVRGILCRGCNTALGNLKDDPERADKLAAYLRRRERVVVNELDN